MAISAATAIMVSALVGMVADYIMHQENRSYNSSEAEKTRTFNSTEAETARLFNSAEAQKDRDFQRYMSSTAHQREVDDLKAAGLNPILSVNSGASMASGAQAVSSFGGSSAQASSNPYYVSNSLNSAIGNAVKFSMEMQPQNTYQKVYRNGKLVRVVATEKSRGN